MTHPPDTPFPCSSLTLGWPAWCQPRTASPSAPRVRPTTWPLRRCLAGWPAPRATSTRWVGALVGGLVGGAGLGVEGASLKEGVAVVEAWRHLLAGWVGRSEANCWGEVLGVVLRMLGVPLPEPLPACTIRASLF